MNTHKLGLPNKNVPKFENNEVWMQFDKISYLQNWAEHKQIKTWERPYFSSIAYRKSK